MQRAHRHERGLLGMRRELLGVQAGDEPVDPARPPGEDAVVGFRGAANQEVVGTAHGQALRRVVVVTAERFDAQARAVSGEMGRVGVLLAERLRAGEIVVRGFMGARDDIAVKRRHDPVGGDGLAVLDQVRPDDVARRADAHHEAGRIGISRIAHAEVAVGGLGRSRDDEAVVDGPMALVGGRHRGDDARNACRLILTRAAVRLRPLHRAVGGDLGNEHVVVTLVLALKIAVVRVGLANRQITRGHRDAVAHIVERGGILHLHDGGEVVGLQGLALHLRAAHTRHPHQVQVVVVLRDDGVGIGLGLARGLHIAVLGRRRTDHDEAPVDGGRDTLQHVLAASAERRRLHQVALGVELGEQAILPAAALALQVEPGRLRGADRHEAAVVCLGHAIEQVGLLAFHPTAPQLAAIGVVAHEHGIRLALRVLLRAAARRIESGGGHEAPVA